MIDYVRHYLAFVERCQRPDGRFRNFMAADGTWLEDLGAPDAQGRAIWGLAFAAAHSAQTEVRLRALRCLDGALGPLRELTWLRSKAFVLLGLRWWMQAEPSDALGELDRAFRLDLAEAFRSHTAADWRWFEDTLTYCNGRLCQALLHGPEQEVGL
ncbi:MAG: hypothetical protein ACYDAG_18610, partial [Chloroflexota bacterium]